MSLNLFILLLMLLVKFSRSCHATCATCLTPDTGLYTECVTCKVGADLTPIAPSPCACMVTYYASPDASNCQACDATCYECITAGPMQCKSCNLNASLTGPIPKDCQCNPNFYPNPDASKCSICSPACMTCTGPLASNCSACVANATPKGSGCSCNDGFWLNTVTNDCNACYFECQKCNGPATTDCTSCYTNAQVSGGACVCKPAFYPSAYANNCLPCHNTCATCRGPNSFECDSCKASASLTTIIAPGTCICNLGSYDSPDSSNCKPCDLRCASCSGPLNTECLSCKSNAYMIAGSPSECACLAGYTAASTAANCVLCDPDCATCFGSLQNQCLTCGSNAHIAGATPNYCYCDNGYARTPDSMHCALCHPACLWCTTTAITTCTKCKAQAHLMGTPPISCICDDGLYNAPDASNCLPCDLTCKTCSAAGPNFCTSCKNSASIVPAAAVGACACDAGWYGAPDASNCVQCEPTCGACTLVSPLTCSGCKLGAVASASGGCTCGVGYFGSPDARNCIACHTTCASCSTYGSTICQSCKAGAELVGGKSPSSCVCSAGFYTTTDASNCLACDSKCATCTGPAVSDCSGCKNGAWMLSGSPGPCTCKSTAFFPNPDASNCTPCDKTCSSCISTLPTACTVCYQYAKLSGAPPTSCVCMTGYLPMPHTGACRCDESCATCSAITNLSCLSCYTNAHLRSIPGPAECLCDDGFYPDPIPKTCTDCHYTCATCNGPANTQCLTCGSQAKMTATPPSSCYCDLGYGMFGRNCQQCYELCADCKATTTNSCTACRSPLILVGGEAMSSCDCPPYNFLSSRNPLECSKCHVKCYTCYDFEHCILCNPTYYQYKNDCYQTCPKNTQVMGFKCVDCFRGCASCKGNLNNECMSCLQWFNFTSSSTCLECPTGQYYESDNSCAPCNNDCFMCDQNGVCLSCLNPAAVVASNLCVPNSCPALCLSCMSATCTSCITGAEISGGTCVCSSGFTQVGEYCVPTYQACAGVMSLNSTQIVIRSEFRLTAGDVKFQLYDNVSSTVVDVNYTTIQLNSTDSIYYTAFNLAYQPNGLTEGNTKILVKFTYLQECISPYNRSARADLTATFPLVLSETWGLPLILKQLAKLPQYFMIAGFFLVAITGRRRALWSFYNVILMISYQGLLNTSLSLDTKKFMLTASRFSVLPNFFNPILPTTASEAMEEAPLAHYGID